jgi:hypothetical protein
MRLIIRHIYDFERYTKLPCYDLRDSLFSTIYAKSPFVLHSFRLGSEVHLDESDLTAGSVVYSSDLRSALEEFFIVTWERSSGRFSFLCLARPARGVRYGAWGSWAVGCYIPVLAFNWGVLGQGMDQDWRLGSVWDYRISTFAVRMMRIA